MTNTAVVLLVEDEAQGVATPDPGALQLSHLTVVAGEPLDLDLRAELDLLRGELDLMKKELRRLARGE